MKRYFLFISYTYYPNGGMGDFQGDFYSIKDAKDFMYRNTKYDKDGGLCKTHIFDTKEKVYVYYQFEEEVKFDGKAVTIKEFEENY